MVMARNINMMTDGSGSGRINKTAKKKATATKTVVTPGTKVSKATIDKIKAMGMTKALKSAGSASPEMLEGLKRMYGARRVAAAGGSKTAKSADEARASASKSSTKVYKSADEARSAYAKSKAPTLGANTVMAAKPSYSQSITKKTSTTSNPFTAAHNKLSPYGNKNQKFVFGSGGKKTVASVKAENSRRMGISVAEYDKRFAAAKKKK
jgi:hypothetical protein